MLLFFTRHLIVRNVIDKVALKSGSVSKRIRSFVFIATNVVSFEEVSRDKRQCCPEKYRSKTKESFSEACPKLRVMVNYIKLKKTHCQSSDIHQTNTLSAHYDIKGILMSQYQIETNGPGDS